MKTSTPRFAADGTRLTDCCGAFSTYTDDACLCCKACWREVSLGQGDGSERRPVKHDREQTV